MPGTIYVNGGFGGASLENASDSLRRRIAAADAEYDRESARQQQARAQRADQLAENSIAASVLMAEQRGEYIPAHDRVRGVGRTRSEAIAFYSAVQDVEDAKRQAKALRRFEAFELEQQNLNSGDMTAPAEIDVSELAELREKAGAYRAKRDLINAARVEAEKDRTARYGSERRQLLAGLLRRKG